VGAKAIIPWLPQLAPRLAGASAKICAAPPLTAIFFSFPSAKKLSHWPSGDKDGTNRSFCAGNGFDLPTIHSPQINLLRASLTGDICQTGAIGRERHGKTALHAGELLARRQGDGGA
jgi:hypothetical protein